MITDETRVSLADLAASGVRLLPVQAVTIARELILQVVRGEVPGMPSAHVIRLCGSGALVVEGPVAAGGRAVSRAAQLLEALLPPREAGPEFKVPGALRLCIVRALGNLDVPPYPSLDSFAEALQRFAAPDPQAMIRGLVHSWANGASTAASARAADASANHRPKQAAQPPEERRGLEAPEHEDFVSHGSHHRTADQLTVSDIRRARRATGVPLSEISARSRIPLGLLRQLEWGYLRNWPAGLYGRTQLVRYARASGLDDQIVISTVWPMLEDAERERRALGPTAATIPVGRAQDAPAAGNSAAEPIVPAPVPIATSSVLNREDDVAETPLVRSVDTYGTAGVADGAIGRPRRRLAVIAAIAAILLMAIALPLMRDRFETAFQFQSATNDANSPATDDASSAGESRPAAAEGPAAPAPDSRQADARASSAPPAGESDVSSAARQSQPPLEKVATTGEPAPQVVRAEPARGLTDEDTAWSPAFAAVGSAMFYHVQAGREGSSALMRADTNGDGAVLRITRVVDDNARNFHARPSPDGTRIAFDSDRDGERGVYIADADGTNVRRVSGEGYAAVPTWSPDGRTLAFIRAEANRPRVWNLWTLDLETGQMQRLTSHKYGQPWGGSWFPDGRRIAYSHETRLIVLDLETGQERIFPSPRKGQLVRTPAVSPDGRRIIFQVFRDGAWLLDLEDESMRKILADPTAEEYTWSPDGRRVAYHSRKTGEWAVWMMVSR